jgi:hypothetical protein
VAIVLGEKIFGSALYSLPSLLVLWISGYPSKTILPKFWLPNYSRCILTCIRNAKKLCACIIKIKIF